MTHRHQWRTVLSLFRQQGTPYYILFALVIAGFVVGSIWYVINHPMIYVTDRFWSRDYGTVERVMTQFRILIYYLNLILIPDNSQLSMWHDDFVVSRSLSNPISTLWCMYLILLLLVLSFASIKRYPLLAFGLLWFFFGHSTESTIFDLELAYEHRNYFPSFGIFLVLSYALVKAYQAARQVPMAKWAVVLGSLGLLTLNAKVLYERSVIWSDDTAKYIHEGIHKPESPRAQFRYSRALLRTVKTDADFKKALAVLEANTKRDLSIMNEMVLLVSSINAPEEVSRRWVANSVRKLEKTGYHVGTDSVIQALLRFLKEYPETAPAPDIVAPLFLAMSESRAPKFITYAAQFELDIQKNPSKGIEYLDRANQIRGHVTKYTLNLIHAQINHGRIIDACRNAQRVQTHVDKDNVSYHVKEGMKVIRHTLRGQCRRR